MFPFKRDRLYFQLQRLIESLEKRDFITKIITLRTSYRPILELKNLFGAYSKLCLESVPGFFFFNFISLLCVFDLYLLPQVLSFRIPWSPIKSFATLPLGFIIQILIFVLQHPTTRQSYYLVALGVLGGFVYLHQIFYFVGPTFKKETLVF